MGWLEGLSTFFSDPVEQTREILRENKAPLVAKIVAAPFLYAGNGVANFAGGIVVGADQGNDKMWNANGWEGFFEGAGQFLGATSTVLGIAAGGVAGARVKFNVPMETPVIGGEGVAGMALATEVVGVPAVTAVAGAVAGGAVAHAMVGGQTSAGVQGGGRSGRSGAVPRQLSGSWKEKGDVIRSLSDEELVLNAEKYAKGLAEKPAGGYNHSRPVADLIVQELKRRGKGKEPVTAQLEKAIGDSFYDYDFQLSAQGRLGSGTLPSENWTAVELRGRANTAIKRLENGVDTEATSFHQQLVQELRERSLAFEGEEASAMRGLADQLEGTLQRVKPGPVGRQDAQIFKMDFDGMARSSLTPDLIREAQNVLRNGAGVDYMRAYASELRTRAFSSRWLERRQMNKLADRLETKITKVEQEQAAAALAEPEFKPGSEVPLVDRIKAFDSVKLQGEAQFLIEFWNRGGKHYYTGVDLIIAELKRRDFSDLAGQLERAFKAAEPRIMGRN